MQAFGDDTAVRIRNVAGPSSPLVAASRRLGWEVRQRTSVVTAAADEAIAFDDSAIFDSPLVYWRGDAAFEPLSESEVLGLRRFVEFGGFIMVDDASDGAFTRSVERALRRALPNNGVEAIASSHVIYRSFYLVDRPLGRRRGSGALRGIEIGDRLAVVISNHDLGGAWARDNLGNWLNSPTPGGEAQREQAIRLGVNLVMYALCLDYKDDQVHAPYLMRRRGPT
ncbi:MAG: DUF4159 domain-containing protein [Myxococcota bacterium]